MLGINSHNRKTLPSEGPAIIAANHNSHLDTLVLMSLYPLSKIHKIRPVAAADYFLTNPILAWLTLKCIGIIPIDRSGSTAREDLFSGCHAALNNGDILIIFPEGSRGNPEEIGTIKKGLFHLIKDHPDIPIIPVLMHGLGKALPRGEALFVPFNCDVIVGSPLTRFTDATQFTETMHDTFINLSTYCITKAH
jgi:1-acyl-sn-glycerol-3-phosphate acyltransferase